MMPEVLPADHPYQQKSQDHGLDKALDNELIELAKEAVDKEKPVSKTLPISNANRTTGATLSSVITKKTGENGLSDNSINFTFQGSAGQSFGAWVVKGITLKVEGDANDYFGKGLSGGRLIVTPPKGSCYKAEKNIIIGNVALYGSTGGEAYINGMAGERFAVRNSAATAVVEGIGDHGCEYMTGGHVVILGPTGRNFGAGMSGGIAFVFDPDQSFEGKFNNSMADLFSVVPDSQDDLELTQIIKTHVKYTGSEVGTALLTDWDNAVKKFKKVLPRDYARVIKEQAEKVANQNNMITKEGIGSHG